MAGSRQEMNSTRVGCLGTHLWGSYIKCSYVQFRVVFDQTQSMKNYKEKTELADGLVLGKADSPPLPTVPQVCRAENLHHVTVAPCHFVLKPSFHCPRKSLYMDVWF